LNRNDNLFFDFKLENSTLSRVLSSLFSGTHVRGIETSEHMLQANTRMTGFGRLVKLSENSNQIVYRLSSPLTEKTPPKTYILTALSQKQIIDQIKGTRTTLKIFTIIFGTIGIVLGGYCVYRLGNYYIAKKRRDQAIQQARDQRIANEELARSRRQASRRETNRNNNNNINSDNSQSSCVICYENPRELVIVDCGHVCMCSDCYEMMPINPKKCPICRREFTRVIPCFIP
jgi:E3 ubiquitin-protein ligase MUL1